MRLIVMRGGRVVKVPPIPRRGRHRQQCNNVPVTSTGPGRPRKQQPTRPGATAREEILDAAAELFTTQGYANTSTRAIADAVGIRQSSLYHHFGTKDDILEELLAGTVAGGLAFARAVCAEADEASARAGGSGESGDPDGGTAAAARLHAVALYDGTQLCSARWNLGVLYHLPEARAERFGEFLRDRRELRSLYQLLGSGLPGSTWPAGSGQSGEFAFRLVESLVNLRADGLAVAESPLQVADAAMALAGFGPELPTIRTASALLIERLG
jgi:AcrR family transcriptional regulator